MQGHAVIPAIFYKDALPLILPVLGNLPVEQVSVICINGDCVSPHHLEAIGAIFHIVIVPFKFAAILVDDKVPAVRLNPIEPIPQIRHAVAAQLRVNHRGQVPEQQGGVPFFVVLVDNSVIVNPQIAVGFQQHLAAVVQHRIMRLPRVTVVEYGIHAGHQSAVYI